MSYKKLGEFIQVVDDRNKELLDLPLLGVSVQKVFIPSIANTVGTDMSKYKILSRNQFTYIPDTSRRGDKIGVALLKTYDKALVSQAYTTFKIIDEDQLNPDYLMMWFTRPEFDRYARYHSIGSVREVFDWEDLCEVELPVPSIEKQREIVAQYQAVENKIKVNEQICEKLEATAQTLYKQWFVDFEFPITKESHPELVSGSHLQTYKSSGGAMVYNEELEKEIPEGWELIEFQKITDVTSGKSVKNPNGTKYPIYGAGGITGFTDDYLFDDNIIVIGRVGTHGKVFIEYDKSYPSDNTLVFTPKYLIYSYFILKHLNYDELNKGGVQALLTQSDLKALKILEPNFYLTEFENQAEKFMIMKDKVENQKLTQFQSLLLSRLATLEG